jgi:hypothetical protein
MSDPLLSPPTLFPDSTQLALEQSVFLASLLDAEAARLVAAADPLCFTKDGWRVAHAALRDLVGRGETVSALALTVELERRGDDLATVERAVGSLAAAGLVGALEVLAEEMAPVPALVPQYLADLRDKAWSRRAQVLAHGLLNQNGSATMAGWEAAVAELQAFQHAPPRSAPEVPYLETFADFLQEPDPPSVSSFPTCCPPASSC